MLSHAVLLFKLHISAVLLNLANYLTSGSSSAGVTLLLHQLKSEY